MSTVRKRIGLLVVVLGMLGAFAAPVFAQPYKWQFRGHIPGGGEFLTCGYFFDANTGVVGGDALYYTVDGTTWLPSSYPPHTLPSPYVLSIRSFDGNTLYAQTDWDELWRSNDHGKSWQIVKSGKGADVFWDYVTNTPVILAPNIGAAVTRMDKNNLMAAPVDEKKQAAPMFSNDGGTTWQQGVFITSHFPATFSSGGIAAYADTLNKIYYSVSEVGTLSIMKSTDLGQTWSILPATTSLGVDDLEGAEDRLYYHGIDGMHVSTDGGNSWSASLGGPGSLGLLSHDDQRFILFGCKGRSIVCFDDSGGIWMATPTSQSMTIQTPSPDVGCSKVRVPVVLSNPNCPVWKITSLNGPNNFHFQLLDSNLAARDTVWLTIDPLGKDTTEVRVVSVIYSDGGTDYDTSLSLTVNYHAVTSLTTASGQTISIVRNTPCMSSDTVLILTNTGCDSLTFTLDQASLSADWVLTPSTGSVTLGPGDHDTIRIRYAGSQIGSFTQTLSYPFLSTSGLGGGTTTVDLTATISATAPSITLSDASIDLGSQTICVDTIFTATIRNTGCDSLFISGTVLSGGGPFQLLNSNDTALAPGEILTHRISYHASAYGLATDVLSQHITHAGGNSSVDTTIPIQATALVNANLLQFSQTAIDLGSRIDCADTVLSVTLHNTGCDSLRITNAHVGGSGLLTLINADDTVLAPGQSLIRELIFHSSTIGPQTDILIQHFARLDGSLASDTTVTITSTVLKSQTKLQSASSTVDIGRTYICEERDTFVVIENPSCEKVCITNVQLTPATFVLANGQPITFCIEAGGKDTVRISSRIDTTGGVTSNFATMTVTSDAVLPLAPMTISRSISYPVRWQLFVSGTDASIPRRDVIYKMVQHVPLPQDVASLDFRLSYADDLLAYTKADESFVRTDAKYLTTDGFAHQMYHLSAIAADTTLATLHFNSFLTKTLTTPIRVDSVSFSSNHSRPNDCVATVLSDSSDPKTYTSMQACGGTLITTELGNKLITFDAIEPNPAREEVRVPYTPNGVGSVNVRLTIEDMLGRTASDRSVEVGLGSPGQITIPLGGLPSGVYRIRIESDGFVWSKQVVKE